MDRWYVAAVAGRLKPGTQHRIMLLGEPVVVGRTPEGEVFALRDVCPHRLVPLSGGAQIETAGEWTLQCPYHGWRFGTDGGCRMMPSLPEDTPHDPARVKVRRYLLEESEGLVFAYVAADPRSAAPPVAAVPALGALPGKPKQVIEARLDLPMDAAVERFLRPGVSDAPQMAPVRKRHHRLVFGAEAMTEVRFEAPGCILETLTKGAARLVTLTCLTPETPSQTRITQIIGWAGAPFLDITRPLMAREPAAT